MRLFGPGLSVAMLGSLVVLIAALIVALRPGRPRTAARLVPLTARTSIIMGSLVTAAILFSPVGDTARRKALDLDVTGAFDGAFRNHVLFFQFVGNILLLSWLAFLLPWAFRRIGVLWAVGICAISSVTVEAVQYLLANGRVSSASDVVFNVLGAAVGAVISGVLRIRVGSARRSGSAARSALDAR